MYVSAFSEIMILVGLVLLVVSFLFRRFLPARVNLLYGYRTRRSMDSDEAWHFAQKLSATYMLRLSVAMLLIGVGFLFIDVRHWSAFLMLGVIFGAVLLGFGILIYLVEKALHSRFGSNHRKF